MRLKGLEKSRGISKSKALERIVFWLFVLVVSTITTVICFNNQDYLVCWFLIYPCAFGIVFSLGGVCEHSVRYYQAVHRKE